MKKLFLLFSILFCLALTSNARDIWAVNDGDWDNANTWQTVFYLWGFIPIYYNDIPQSDDDAVISSSYTVNIPSNYTAYANTLTLNPAATQASNTYLTFSNNTSTLSITSDFVSNATSTTGGSAKLAQINLGSGTLLIGGDLILEAGKKYASTLNVGSGYLSVSGNINLQKNTSSYSVLDLSNNNGVVEIGSNFIIADKKCFNPFNSTIGATINYVGTSEQTIETQIKYNNIGIYNTVGVVLGGDIDLDGSLLLNSGYIHDSGYTITGSNNGDFTMNNSSSYVTSSTFPTNFTSYILSSSSTTEYNGSNQTIQDVGTTGYGYLYLSGSGTKTNSGNTYVQRNLTVESGVIYSITNTTSISGDLYNNGSITSSTNAIISFEGPASKTINGNQIDFDKLTISGVGSVTLNTPVTVSNVLSMDYGILFSSSTNTLTIKNAATASIGNANSYVDGPINYEMALSGTRTLQFPIGKGSDWRPVELTVSHTPATSYTYIAEVHNESAKDLDWDVPTDVTHVSDVSYWSINRFATSNLSTQVPSAGLNGDQFVTLYYGSNDGTEDPSNLTLVKGTPTEGAWTNINGSASGGSISSGAFTSFSEFALGNLDGGANTLPVELTSFTAFVSPNGIQFSWLTESELNNDYFTLEYSIDGINFNEISIINGQGSSTEKNEYEYIDENNYSGLVYFRLRQTDFDGTESISQIIAVTISQSLEIFLYPNPTTDIITIDDSKNVITHTAILNSSLQQVTAEEINTNSFDVSNLPSGIYFITISTNSETFTKQFIKE